MKRNLPNLLLAIIFFSFSVADAQINKSGNKYDLLLISGTVNVSDNVALPSTYTVDANETVNGKYYRIIQFNSIPSTAEKSALKAHGVELLQYVPEYSYLASVASKAQLQKLATSSDVRAILPVEASYKIHPALKDNNLPDYAEVVAGKADLTITLYNDISTKYVENAINHFATVLESDDAAHRMNIRVNKVQVNAIIALPFVQYVEPVDQWYVENYTGTTLDRSNTINSYSSTVLHFDGTGVGVTIGDGGAYYIHPDIKGRQTGGSGSGADHGTHVAGILVGAGNINPRYHGHAPGATVAYYSSFNDISSVTTLTNLYNGINKVRVTNHSLAQTENAGYTSDARTADLEVESLPSIFNVHSCGNNGSSYYTITGGYKAAKNSIATGNLDYKDAIASSSSRGPSKDGRIKPDICAKGTSVYSCMPGDTYASMTGTSMASPGAAGCFTQLIHAYRSLNGGADPALAMLKGVVLNTADDLGIVGPDYTFGWGRINSRKAYNLINDHRYLSGSIDNGQTITHTIAVPPNVKEMKVMVYWADPAAAAGVSKALINDIDISVTDGANTYSTWLLNPTSPSLAATKGVDTDNNMEQVSIVSPAAGNYTLSVKGSVIGQGPQTYWVSYDFIMDEIVVTHPGGGESLVPGETEYIRWDAYGSSGNFSVEYSTNGGASWSSIATATSSARYLSWTVPSVLTGKAMVRVSRSGISGASQSNFNIIGVPSGLNIASRCANEFRLAWNALSGATGYEVYLLGQKYMETQGTTANLSLTVSAPNTAIQWVSVRALADSGRIYGRRAIAISVNTPIVNCTTPVNEIAAGDNQVLNVFPNPLKSNSTVVLNLERNEEVSIRLVDVLGKTVQVLADKSRLRSGENTFALDGLPVEGMYYILVEGDSGILCKKVVVAN